MADQPSFSDRSLLHRFQGGEASAAAEIYQRYAHRVQRLAEAQMGSALASRLDPEDIVQSVFRTFFRRTRCGHYEVPEGEELWKLFLVISLNKIRSTAVHHRSAKRNVGMTVGLGDQDVARNAAEEDECYLTLRMVIDELLRDMPTAQQEMIVLRIEGHDVAEIATRTQRAKRSVERVLQSFRQRLAAAVCEEVPALASDLFTPSPGQCSRKGDA